MPFNRINQNVVSLDGVKTDVTLHLKSKIPEHRNWFGVAASRINQTTNAPRTVAANIVIAVSDSIAKFVHAIKEFDQNLYLTPPLVTDRWIQHVKNTYLDYYGEEKTNQIVWDKASTETVEDYQARILEIATELKSVFKTAGVTLQEIKSYFENLTDFGVYGEVSLRETWKNLKPYPSAKLYVPTKFVGESDDSFNKRCEVYRKYYYDNLNYYSDGRFSKQINSTYPVQFLDSELLSVSGITTNTSIPGLTETGNYIEPADVKKQRIRLLKNQLGSYTSYLEGSTKKYFNIEDTGGIVDVYVKTTNLNFEVPESFKNIRPAGVLTRLHVSTFLGETQQLVFDTQLYFADSTPNIYLGSYPSSNESVVLNLDPTINYSVVFGP
jgi:hypothetical protein